MAKSKYELEILGDNSKFNRTVSQSMERLDELSAHTGGFFGGVSGGAQRATGALNALTSMTPGLAALGIAGAGAALAFKTLSDTIDYVGKLNQISTATGVSVESLQKLQSEFRATGLEIEKFGDINKDAMDHIGDAIRNGKGGIADDLQEYGYDLKNLTKYAGDAERGIKTVIDVFYEMKKAGRSQAEIVNMMESVASDSSAMISTLEQYKNTTEALSAVQGQHARVTNETAQEYQEFEKNMKQLGETVDGFKVQVISPLIGELNSLWDMFNKDWTTTDFMDTLKHFYYGGDTGFAKVLRQMDGQYEDSKGNKFSIEEQKRIDFIKARAKDLYDLNQQLSKEDQERSRELAKINKAQAEEQKKLDDKKNADALKAAAEQKRVNDKMLADRKAAFEKLASINSMLYSGGAGQVASGSQQNQAALNSLKNLLDGQYITQEQYTEKRKQLISKAGNDFALLLLGADPKTLSEMVNGTNAVYDQQLADLNAKRQKNMIDQQTYNQQLENIEIEHKARLDAIKGMNSDLMNSQMATDMDSDTVEDRMALAQAQLDQQATQWLEAQKSMYEAGAIDYETFLQNKQRLDEMYSSKSRQISMMEAKERLQTYTNMADGIGAVASLMGGEQSKAAKAAFAVSKGLSVAQGLINANEAATKAMAMYPGPIGIAMAATSYASAIGQVMQMKSVQGQFHDGIDDVPNTGTYLLEGGERVVDKRLNQDLKDFLGDSKSGSNQPAQNIDASISNIKTTLDERQLMNVLKKQQQTITSIVNDGNRRKM
ncbi:hypothetical protein KGP17_17635 [Serratia sp. JSRIV001]|uniref:SHOCT domain-containing protein n=1 Tax=Serratia sp. JSRIV001 TaxID=2831893 RepID=UPI001CBAF759|nr:hypothetical protein [Serratia sp. JSRIV001]UAN44275.1 hypothetical protein KGP17_17635 [Serratia sp. JSRIV001]